MVKMPHLWDNISPHVCGAARLSRERSEAKFGLGAERG